MKSEFRKIPSAPLIYGSIKELRQDQWEKKENMKESGENQ